MTNQIGSNSVQLSGFKTEQRYRKENIPTAFVTPWLKNHHNSQLSHRDRLLSSVQLQSKISRQTTDYLENSKKENFNFKSACLF